MEKTSLTDLHLPVLHTRGSKLAYSRATWDHNGAGPADQPTEAARVVRALASFAKVLMRGVQAYALDPWYL